ncbi:YceI family protein [Phenylobacterium sp. J367]|uniref:YceI family protein n=1 Tax=Phenylobacterium sp. J367 TaxID=2898435 RepID=UPI0021517BA8|nr:YceI family protein [Phenylobacterium sp. J367]MCR5881018.1 YceI family protein [Phenylobacterium sp. J367]
MRLRLLACAALTLTACSPPAEKAAEPQAAAAPAAGAPKTLAEINAVQPITAPAGRYALDPTHSTVTFQVSHLGFSNYTAGFDQLGGALQFDPANPAAMSVEATIDVASLDLPAPPAGFKTELLGAQWFDVGKHPQITFRSTKVEPTGPRAARVTGDLTLHGVTRPVTLEATFNGGYPPGGMDPGGARVGFSAKGAFKRSDFGMGYGVPAPGTSMGVGDEVAVAIETEWSMAAAPAG